MYKILLIRLLNCGKIILSLNLWKDDWLQEALASIIYLIIFEPQHCYSF